MHLGPEFLLNVLQEDEGDDENETPSADAHGMMELSMRSMQSLADAPESPMQQPSPLKRSGGSAVGSMTIDKEEEMQHFARMQVLPSVLHMFCTEQCSTPMSCCNTLSCLKKPCNPCPNKVL